MPIAVKLQENKPECYSREIYPKNYTRERILSAPSFFVRLKSPERDLVLGFVFFTAYVF